MSEKAGPICQGCGKSRNPRQYLCADCWWLLKPWVRTSLLKRDDAAMVRRLQLHGQIRDGRPLEDIEVHA